MNRSKLTSKGSNDKIPIFVVGDIVRIVPNHKPYTSGITRKYPHGKELINHICFIEEVIGDRYSLYALEKPAKRKFSDESWYVGDLLESCLEPYSLKCVDCNDLINKMPIDGIKEYRHFIYPEDVGNILLRIKEQENLT